MSNLTDTIRRRYDRLAPWFDALEGVLESWAFGPWRRQLWSRVDAGNWLEVGVGTGKNFPYHPADADITAIDFSPAMLERARRKLAQSAAKLRLELMDVERLEYADHSFDGAVATFVFCSVPDPVQGLREVFRVCKPGATVWLLEHVRSESPAVGRIMDALNPWIVRLVGANINRRTVDNVVAAGFILESVDSLGHGGLVKLIQARKPDFLY